MRERQKITKEVKVELDYEISKEGILCHNHATFRHFWGSNAVPTYLRDIKLVKDGWRKSWLIPKWKLVERRDFFKKKMEKYQSNIDLVESIIGVEIKPYDKDILCPLCKAVLQGEYTPRNTTRVKGKIVHYKGYGSMARMYWYCSECKVAITKQVRKGEEK